jgi:hypothetical protein
MRSLFVCLSTLQLHQQAHRLVLNTTSLCSWGRRCVVDTLKASTSCHRSIHVGQCMFGRVITIELLSVRRYDMKPLEVACCSSVCNQSTNGYCIVIVDGTLPCWNWPETRRFKHRCATQRLPTNPRAYYSQRPRLLAPKP